MIKCAGSDFRFFSRDHLDYFEHVINHDFTITNLVPRKRIAFFLGLK